MKTLNILRKISPLAYKNTSTTFSILSSMNFSATRK